MRWTQSAVSQLQDCLEITDWNVFRDLWTDLDQYTETVCDYIKFCVDQCIPTKTITVHSNNKMWFNEKIKSKIKKKDQAYKTKHQDTDMYRTAKRELKKSIKEHKVKYKNKLESVFSSGDSKKLWSHMNEITNYKGTRQSLDNCDTSLPNKLNEFYARFDKDNNTSPVPEPIPEDAIPPFTVSEHQVRSLFKKQKITKAAGPDGIKPRFLKICSDQIAYVFTYIFNWSLELSIVPSCFKFSTIIPVPKKSSPESLNDYRPVALTSVISKCFEKLVLQYINNFLPRDFDSFQFAYREKRSTDDAIAINVHEILNHAEKSKTYSRVLFIDYSSAFNTIIPQKLYMKLLKDLNFPLTLCNWILDFLLNRPQLVKIGEMLSSTIVINTGTPQGCPISPKLYSLFTFDCKAHLAGNHVFKFADDTTVTGLISDNNEDYYRREIDGIVNWCDNNNLFLNVSKTKEIIVDFRKNKNNLDPVIINNSVVEQISVFKFLGCYLTDDLSWHYNCTQILKKARQRLFFLRKLSCFKVKSQILLSFYRAIIESVLTSNITVWYGRATQKDINLLSNVISQAGKIILDKELPSLDTIYRERLARKTQLILSDISHPARAYFDLLPSGRRYRHFKGNKRFLDSTYSQAVKLLNRRL